MDSNGKIIRVSSIPLILLGKLYGKTSDELAMELRGETTPPVLDGLPDIERGKWLESVALELLEKELGAKIIGKQMEVATQDGLIVGHIDGFTSIDGGDWVVEVKCPRSSRIYHLEEGLPPQYVIQAAIYAKLLALQTGHVGGAIVAVLDVDGWSIRKYSLAYSDYVGLTSRWLQQVRDWYSDVMSGRVPPKISVDVPVIGRTVRGSAEVEPREIGNLVETVCELAQKKAELSESIDEILPLIDSSWPCDEKKIVAANGCGHVTRTSKGVRVYPRKGE